MRVHTKTALATLTATLALAIALTTTANAGHFRFSEKEFRIPLAPLSFAAAGNNISCPITFSGHFNESTVAKRAGTVGAITRLEPTTAGAPPCTGGSITILTETLPWRFNYVSFRGTLPRIESIRLSLIGVAFQVRTGGGTVCLVGTTATSPAFGEALVEANGRVTGLRGDETVGIPLGGGFNCSLAGESFFTGTGTVTNLPGTAAVTVTLI